MAYKQFVALLTIIALAIIYNVEGASIPRDIIIKDETNRTEQTIDSLPTQIDLVNSTSLEQKIFDDTDFPQSYENAKSLGKKTVVIVITTTTAAPNTTNTTTTTTTTTAKPIIYKKPFLGFLDATTKDKIRTQLIANRIALQQILASGGVGSKVQIVYARRNLNDEDQIEDENIFDLKHYIQDGDKDDDGGSKVQFANQLKNPNTEEQIEHGDIFDLEHHIKDEDKDNDADDKDIYYRGHYIEN